ncbi:MAG: cytochrome c3 family protein [Desulfovibrio sp.]|jgi:hypothetical protein|nr:cytochrome c3 family protein [Desulfovibrio sp.]
MKKNGIFSACLLCADAAVTALIAAVRVSLAVVAIIVAAVAAATAVAAGTATAAAASPPPEPTELNWSRRPVLFSHQTHLNAPALRSGAGVSARSPAQPEGGGNANSQLLPDSEVCASCHHPVDGMTRHLACATQDCHDNLNPKDKSVRSYYLSTHAAPKGRFYSCVACHTEQAGDDAPTLKRMAGCEESACHN